MNDELIIESFVINRMQMFFSLLSIFIAAAIGIAFITVKLKLQNPVLGGIEYMICLTSVFLFKKK